MIYINNKIPSYGKHFLNENNVNTGTLKTSIDQSAVGNTEQTNVTLDLADDSGPEQDQAKKKKKKEEKHTKEEEKKKLVVILSDDDVRTRNLLLLNLL
jgi:hypothetical protein